LLLIVITMCLPHTWQRWTDFPGTTHYRTAVGILPVAD
jgi:hypothetical protein